jgi:hypothetical protein
MTSAVTYNESKASMASASKHSSNPSGRVGLSINDIIDGAAGDQSCNTLKRKAGDISEAIENDIQVWASSPFAANGLVTSTATAESRSQHTNRREQSENTPAPLAAVSEHRPAKRLRKLVERAGYVALGGAALFGALVLSAPDFL